MKPGERSNRGKKPSRSPSPPHSRPSKVTKRPSTHGPSKLRNPVRQSEQTSYSEAALLDPSQESTAREHAISSRDMEAPSGQTVPKASRSSGLRMRLRFLREPTVQDGSALPKPPLTDRTPESSSSSEDEVIHKAALTLFNMRAVRPPAQRQSTLTTSAVDLIADTPAVLRPDALGDEIRLKEEKNRIITAAQTLMSMRYLEPPRGPGAWKNGGFRLLPRENEVVDGSDHKLVISNNELENSDRNSEVSDDDSEDSLLEVQGDSDIFRGTRTVW
jgi:hypothetical protein